MPTYPGVDVTTPNSPTTIFTNAGQTDLTLNFRFNNRNAQTALVRAHLVDQGDAAPPNMILNDRPLRAKGAGEIWALTIGPGAKLVVQSSLANLNVVPFGRV